MTSTDARQANLDGFDLHANVHVVADNREGLKQLARYALRAGPADADCRRSSAPDLEGGMERRDDPTPPSDRSQRQRAWCSAT